MMNMADAYIGIGSNLGGRKENCSRAVELIQQKAGDILLRSSLYKTVPWGVENQPFFINMALKLLTPFKPLKLLRKLKGIELEMGRQTTVRWGPRVIDLDILFYSHDIIRTKALQVPHPRVHERLFVLVPMMEIAPDFIHPLLKKSIKQLYEEVRDHEKTHPLRQ